MSTEDELVVRARLQDDLSRPLARVRAEVAGVNRETSQTGRHAATASGGLTNMERATGGLERRLRTANSALESMSRSLGNFVSRNLERAAIGLGALGTAAAVFGLKASSSFQQSQIAFETLLGSAEAGRALFQQLQAINLKTPFELKDITSSTQLLLRYGVAADQVVPVLKSLLDAAALSGNPTENLNRLALATGQVLSQGRLLGQDARQLAESGINAYQIYQEKLGLTPDQVRKLGAEGKLSADVFLQALIGETGPLAKFKGGAEKLATTLSGQLSNVKDALNVGLAQAAQPAVSVLSGLIGTPDKPGILLAGLTSLVSTVGPPLFQIVGQIAQLFSQALPAAQPVLAAIVTGLGRLLTAAGPALSALAPLGNELGVALTQLVDALVPVMPDLVKAFVALVEILPEFVRLLTDLVPLGAGIARLMTGLLQMGPVRTAAAGLLTALLGYRALSGVIRTLYAFARGIGAIGEAQAGAAGAGGLSGGALGRIGLGIGGGALALKGATGNGLGADLETIGGGALTGAAIGGPWGALVGGALGAGWVAGRHIFGAPQHGGGGGQVDTTPTVLDPFGLSAQQFAAAGTPFNVRTPAGDVPINVYVNRPNATAAEIAAAVRAEAARATQDASERSLTP